MKYEYPLSISLIKNHQWRIIFDFVLRYSLKLEIWGDLTGQVLNMRNESVMKFEDLKDLFDQIDETA